MYYFIRLKLLFVQCKFLLTFILTSLFRQSGLCTIVCHLHYFPCIGFWSAWGKRKKNSREHAFPCQRFHANALTWPHASLKSAVNHWLPVYLWSHPMRSHSTSPRSQGFDRLTIASHLSATVRPRQKRTFGIIRQRNRYWSRYHVCESRMSVFFWKEFSRKTYKSKGPMQRMCEKKNCRVSQETSWQGGALRPQ